MTSTPFQASRRQILSAACATAIAALAPAARAQGQWPDKLIKLTVAFPPGGPTDTAARIVAQRLTERLGQTIVIDNRPGASGSVGTAAFIKSQPDGYSLSMFGMPALLAPMLFNNNLYDVRKDFLPVATVYDLPMAIVINPRELPDVTNLQQLIEHARKAKPALNYTSSGTGSFGHLSMEQLKDLGGFDMQHVPYRGSAPAVTDLIGGQIAVMFADVVAALPHIQAGKLRAIAVSSQKAKQLLPNVKSVAEQGFPGFDADTWGGLIAPLNTPPAVVQRLNQELKLILAEPELQKKMLAAGAIATYQDGAAMKARLNADFTRWSKIAKDKNISSQ
ncbi:MAG: tripartite tricarboxylate transporter substrate binding protein [Delftia acidovorans]|uniref:tripartite tricarboxylate transporter substrate binding protein n=1 Tax=Delftia sp. UME58 TaxID=1862322 RepID=UPI0016029335|nr:MULTISPECIES: tripartite tricarboxylate transporter substrate binding protein [Delftia]MBB1649525.1 ABC transporter substrate-binding protein [Delftia sp. UME58]MBL8355883.1 tripartite tricarboxylate transporter substrate binding protein [Delftia acidovorans]